MNGKVSNTGKTGSIHALAGATLAALIFPAQGADPALPEGVATVGKLNTVKPAAPASATAEAAPNERRHGAGISEAPAGRQGVVGGPHRPGRGVLLGHVSTGFQGMTGVMPPRGGNPNLSDTGLKAAME